MTVYGAPVVMNGNKLIKYQQVMIYQLRRMIRRTSTEGPEQRLAYDASTEESILR
jgi:hypothetical protein